jgi:protein O-GlcNAc transferase
MADADSIYHRAVSLQQAGDADGAEALYRQLLEVLPAHGSALANLGLLVFGRGAVGEAIALLERAIAIQPDTPDFHHNLGLILAQSDRPSDAVPHLRIAALLRPTDFASQANLGMLLAGERRFDEAVEVFEAALRVNPNEPAAWMNLGLCLHDLGRMDQAVAAMARAGKLSSNDPAIHYALGTTLYEAGRSAEAVAPLSTALTLDPSSAPAANNLGLAYREVGQPDDAIAAFNRAVDLSEGTADCIGNLAQVQYETGRFEESLASFRLALKRNPPSQLYSTFLYSLLFQPSVDSRQIRGELDRWNATIPTMPPPSIADASFTRRLRIGYVSPNFCNHVVGRFLLPLLSHHDHQAFEIFCYDDTAVYDSISAQLRAPVDQWRLTRGLADDALAELIRADQIDILVDLTMHMAGSRLLMFARRPAPVQATYLAYAGTTGLAAMDYRLTDNYLDPPGGDESIYSEKSFRLARSYWCYQPPREAPLIGASPMRKNGFVTFGCLNNFCKINPKVIEVWSRILRDVPNARLHVHSLVGSHRQNFLDAVAIDPSRISFIEKLGASAYFAAYNDIDIALDTFPYPGGTTSCDALWIGVPVVTRAGDNAIARAGVSILSNIDATQWIAESDEQYVAIATTLASDSSQLLAMRSSLRSMMLNSPLMDAVGFTRDIETAYRYMWTQAILRAH